MSYKRNKSNPLEDASDLLFIVESEWPKITLKNFNPLDTVLPLLDNTSVGLAHKYSKFVQLNDQISNVLNDCIDSNKQQFIDHLSYYHDVSINFNESFQLVEEISNDLSRTNDSIISDNKTYLKDLNYNSQVYGRLLDTIEGIEFVKNATDELNNLIGDKNFIRSQELINQSFKLAQEFQLWKLPLLQSIRHQLEDQENNLFEVVVEELHSIIYLKTNVNKNLLNFNNNDQLIDVTSKCSLINKNLLNFIAKINDQDDEEEQDLNLQNLILEDDENFMKLKNLLIILQKLNKFDKLLEILIARETTELNQLFNQTVEDIKLRNPSSVTLKNYWQDNNSELLLLEFGPSPLETLKLREFFNNIFNKSLVVLQYHRIVYEIASKYNRDYAIEKIFEIMESSLRSILTQYIFDEEIMINPRMGKDPVITMKKPNKQHKLFQFKDVENEEMTKLTSQLQEFFPSFNVDDKKIYLDDNEINTNLETIVEPDVFNMRIILEPFLVFVEGSKSLMPMSKKMHKTSSDLFFIEFMRSDYLKNFDLTLRYYYDLLCTSNDPFDILINNDGIFKSCEVFQNFLYSVLEMLNTSLSYKEEYVNSVFILLNAISNRFHLLYQEIADEEDFNWLHNKQLTKVSIDIMKQQDESLVLQETDLIFKNLNIGNEVIKFEVFFEKCTQLLNSIQWLLRWLPNILKIDDQQQQQQAGSKVENFKQNWELVNINYNHNHNKKVYLTLNTKNADRFQKFINGFQVLEENIMLILRYNLIYQSIYLVLKFFNTNEFHIQNEINQPDLNILKLTSIFLNATKIFNKNLNNTGNLVTGLAIFLDNLFIKGSFRIKRMNNNGMKKIFLNILILQQLLRNLFQLEVKFVNSLQYFDNFKMNDKGLIDQVSKQKNKFSYDENKNMIRLIYSLDDLKNTKRYDESVLKLKNLY